MDSGLRRGFHFRLRCLLALTTGRLSNPSVSLTDSGESHFCIGAALRVKGGVKGYTILPSIEVLRKDGCS